MACDEKKTRYAVDGIERAKKAAECPCSDGGAKVGSGPMVPMADCSKSRSVSAFLVVRVVQIPYCDRLRFTCFFLVRRQARHAVIAHIPTFRVLSCDCTLEGIEGLGLLDDTSSCFASIDISLPSDSIASAPRTFISKIERLRPPREIID